MHLEFLNNELKELGVPYKYGNWGNNPPNVYFVGEELGIEQASGGEDGRDEGEIILNGFSKTNYEDLKVWRDKIFRRFRTGQRTHNMQGSCTIV